jgi:hypothetical protein
MFTYIVDQNIFPPFLTAIALYRVLDMSYTMRPFSNHVFESDLILSRIGARSPLVLELTNWTCTLRRQNCGWRLPRS